jgi:NitT/TauT family transport system substrate-binding protein
MHDLGLDKKHDVDVKLVDLASNEAGQVALQSGKVDVILSDFVWVSIQRSQGNKVTFVPHSLAVGGLMVDPKAGIKSVADLKGKVVAATTPVDKSWVILSAYYNKLTGDALTQDAKARYGAPPLINQLLTRGQVQAALNFWSWNAKAKIAGDKQLISIPAVLSKLGVAETPPLLGWAFKESTAKTKPEALKAFLDASFDTKHALLTDDTIWTKLRDVMRVGDNDKLFAALRDGYREGIVQSYDPANTQAAAQTFALLLKYGGKDVVGNITALPPGTFYQGYSNKEYAK